MNRTRYYIKRQPREQTKMSQLRDLRILDRLASGYGYAQIAAEENVGYDAIKMAALRLFQRLGADNQAHAVAIAFRRRILHIPD